MKFQIIHESSRERQPHEKAIACYGKWHECKRQIMVSEKCVGNTVKMHNHEWYELKETILDAPDSDVKRNARLEGDDLMWEGRDKTFWIEVADLPQLLDIIKDSGALFCDNGRYHIEVFE